MNQLTSNVPRGVFASASSRFEALDHEGDPHGCRRQLKRRRENQTPPSAARPKDATSVKPLGRAALQAGVEQVRPRQYAAWTFCAKVTSLSASAITRESVISGLSVTDADADEANNAAKVAIAHVKTNPRAGRW